LHLAGTLMEHAATERCVVVDCLTLWLSNLLFSGRAAQQVEAGEEVLVLAGLRDLGAAGLLPQLAGALILVSNEVGLGIVPLGAVTRCMSTTPTT